MKSSLSKKILLTGWIALGGLTCATATAQGSSNKFDPAYEQALLDSLISYELLKPIHHTLTKKNELLTLDNLALKAENSMLRVQLSVQREQFERMLADERKKRRKRILMAFGAGYVTGKITPPY
ncbi:hypothetical protein SAMN04487996_12272 [Dyadobacter soli]|uniref:Outer membrane efflux protein n=1 Tax=Dyadobacter soli TaxID=659014 RepID=A0A1G7WJW7_9BACT|nr:hypothetical protein [Dyadobacter soli]SDG72158.1 hypothetical protein SAMN04487996_12272 [Dyadobacter soli]